MSTKTKHFKHHDSDSIPSTSSKAAQVRRRIKNMNTIIKDSNPSLKKSSNWDVEAYRTEHESDEHWNLRRSFMLEHKDRFDEERLVCLAQTFVNMEFLGCKYPSETMLLVAELSKDIAEDFRKKHSQRLKRTFVSASEAAEQRAKGYKTQRPQQSQETDVPVSRGHGRERSRFGGGEPIDLFDGLRYGNLVINLCGGRSCLRNCCNNCKVKYEERVTSSPNDSNKIAEVLINNEVIASYVADNQKTAKAVAYKQALLYLQAHCYSIKLNASRATIKVEKRKNVVSIDVVKESADRLIESRDATSKGYHMMRLMGWTGGGLGRLKQGREEPIGYLLKNNRSGFGATNDMANMRNYYKLIENYVKSDDMRDMQFEPTFSKEERASLHQIASKFSLRSTSHGVGENRRLLITKNITSNEILKQVLLEQNEKFCQRYFVQVPMQKAYLFPSHVIGLDLDDLHE